MSIFLEPFVRQLLQSVFIAVITSVVTLFLARKKFVSERMWEKKVLAYERVLEAFHDAKKFDSEHIDAEYKGREVSEERATELRRLHKEARQEIARASDIGSFLLSERAVSILAKYEAEADNAPREDSWQEHLDVSWTRTHRYMKEFMEVAKSDLLGHKDLRPPPFK